MSRRDPAFLLTVTVTVKESVTKAIQPLGGRDVRAAVTSSRD